MIIVSAGMYKFLHDQGTGDVSVIDNNDGSECSYGPEQSLAELIVKCKKLEAFVVEVANHEPDGLHFVKQMLGWDCELKAKARELLEETNG